MTRFGPARVIVRTPVQTGEQISITWLVISCWCRSGQSAP